MVYRNDLDVKPSISISKIGNTINPCVTIECQAFYFRVNLFLFFCKPQININS